MNFSYAQHLLDADGVQVTAEVTQYGDVYIHGNTAIARLTPALAEKLAALIAECARQACVRHDGGGQLEQDQAAGQTDPDDSDE